MMESKTLEKLRILIIDGKDDSYGQLKDLIFKEGFIAQLAESKEEALNLVRDGNFQVIIIDLDLLGINGIDLLKEFKEINPFVSVIIITAHPTVDSAIAAVREGAYDYIKKPFAAEEIKLVLHRVAERQYLLEEAGQKEFYRTLSILDSLTGVYNRRYFNEILSHEIARSQRYQDFFSLLMIDIDDFKEYNDKEGHLNGDELLRKISAFFTKAVRSVDMVFRYGGEEFLILCPHTPKQGAQEVARRLVNLTRETMPVKISIGVVTFPDDANSAEEILENVDKAMYQAKRLGKDRFYVCIQEKKS